MININWWQVKLIVLVINVFQFIQEIDIPQVHGNQVAYIHIH